MTASGCEYFGSPDAGDAMGTLAARDVYRALAASATEQGGCTWLQFEKDGRTCCVALRKDRVRLYTRAATADSAAGGALDLAAGSAATSSAPRGAEGGGSAGGVSDFSAESASTLSAPRGAEGGGSAAEGLEFSAESASTLSMPRGAESGGALSMRMQQKRATAAVWENSSLILLEGEIGLELDADNNTVGQKIGNGLDVWSALPYSTGGGHVLQDSAGIELPKEGVLQFAGMEVTDDPAGGKTVVHGLGVKLADRAPVPGVPLHAVLKPVGVAPPVPPEGRADGTTLTVDGASGVWSVAKSPQADKLATPRKIGSASFDGSADITLAHMGLSAVTEDITSRCSFGNITGASVLHTQYDKLHILTLTSLTVIEYTWTTFVELPASAGLPTKNKGVFYGTFAARDNAVTQFYPGVIENSPIANRIYFMLPGKPVLAGNIIDGCSYMYLEI